MKLANNATLITQLKAIQASEAILRDSAKSLTVEDFNARFEKYQRQLKAIHGLPIRLSDGYSYHLSTTHSLACSAVVSLGQLDFFAHRYNYVEIHLSALIMMLEMSESGELE